jgi:hypothetical protein
MSRQTSIVANRTNGNFPRLLSHLSILATKRQYKTKHIFHTFFTIFITVAHEITTINIS